MQYWWFRKIKCQSSTIFIFRWCERCNWTLVWYSSILEVFAVDLRQMLQWSFSFDVVSMLFWTSFIYLALFWGTSFNNKASKCQAKCCNIIDFFFLHKFSWTYSNVCCFIFIFFNPSVWILGSKYHYQHPIKCVIDYHNYYIS